MNLIKVVRLKLSRKFDLIKSSFLYLLFSEQQKVSKQLSQKREFPSHSH